jgi:hypothetical protein
MFGIVRAGCVFKAGDPGIVDDDVDCRMRLGERRPIAFARDIQLEEAATDFVGYALSVFGVYISNNHSCAFAGKAAGDGLPNAARGTGDKGGFVLKFGHFGLSKCLPGTGRGTIRRMVVGARGAKRG